MFLHRIPSFSPLSLLTLRCSQSSKSFAASFCALISLYPSCRSIPRYFGATYIVLLFHVDLPSILSNSQFLLFTQALYPSVVLFVTNSSSWCQKERTGDHGDDKWESEEGEWVTREAGAVFGGDGVGGGGGAELFGLENCHDDFVGGPRRKDMKEVKVRFKMAMERNEEDGDCIRRYPRGYFQQGYGSPQRPALIESCDTAMRLTRLPTLVIPHKQDKPQRQFRTMQQRLIVFIHVSIC